ncbi:FMN-binding negative transcriptional regulator [Bradyrhizobium ivorense]|uniref:FMN-binding negative transcriptional regulator n=1 Tax=Bradyrhizobium TaxID=374 RepID=UPI0035569C67
MYGHLEGQSAMAHAPDRRSSGDLYWRGGLCEYPSKRQAEHVVPTWNYIAVHAHGPTEFFEDPDRLLEIVTRLTNIHETSRATPWAVSDAPADFIAAQLREIVGVRIPITRAEGKRKMSQDRPVPDRIGVATGLAASKLPRDREVAALILVQG